MFSTRVPKYLWGEAILTFAYLIDKLPSCILSSNLPFKTFGFSTFVQVYPQNMSKLPRSIKCVFISYSTNKKG